MDNIYLVMHQFNDGQYEEGDWVNEVLAVFKDKGSADEYIDRIYNMLVEGFDRGEVEEPERPWTSAKCSSRLVDGIWRGREWWSIMVMPIIDDINNLGEIEL